MVEAHEFTGKPDLVGEINQGFAALVLLDLAGAGQQRIEVAVFVDQGGGGLDADARRAWHIIHGIAAQRLNVDDLVRGDAELLQHLRIADAEVLHGVEHGDPIPDKLHQVLVGGNNHHLAAGVADLGRVGGDNVVGLITGLFERGHAERPRRLAHQRELRDQVFWRRRTVRLVLGVERIAEGLLGVVENHRQMGRRVGRGLPCPCPREAASNRLKGCRSDGGK